MPGARTLAELVAARLGPGAHPPAYLANLAAVQGLALDTLLADGQSADAAYQYLSPLSASSSSDHDVRGRLAGTPLEAQLVAAGRACAAAIPGELRRRTAFSLDGVVDGTGALWLLEANCNPQLHPSFYAGMLDDLFLAAP